MDELLSLFNAADDNAGDNDTSHQETQLATQTSKSTKYHSSEGAPSLSTNNNDFGSSFASAFATSNTTKRNTNEENVLNKSRVIKQHHTYTATTTKSTATTHKHKSNNTSSCDPYTNFVITDRRTSRANMVNAFSTLTYKSCSVLAASSRAEWNTFMVDGGGSGNGPSGKTKLATCGILTQDVSSKLSSKTGRAFAKLSLGDLPSSSSSNMHSTIARGSNNINPSITVFLFGDAINILKSNMKYMKAGYAVAILQPNLMPNNNNSGGSGTSITLSINNPSQLLPIGRCSDVNKCKGTMRVRTQSEYGGIKWEDARCTTLVDCRLGGYCDKHKRQGLGNGGGKSSISNKGNSNSMTFMQKQRTQRQQGMSQMRGNNNRGDIWLGQRGGHTNSSSFNNLGHQSGRSTTSSSLSEALSQSGLLGQQSSQQAISSSSGGSKQQLLKRAPLHLKKSQPISSSTTGDASNKLPAMASASRSSSTIKNPYNNKSSQSKSSNSRKRKEVDDILGEALDRTRSIDKPNHRPEKMMKKKKTSLLSSSTNTTKRSAKVFTTEGYDGAVHVPKPNKLLFQHGSSSSSAASSMITPSPDNNRLSSALILDKQRNLAELLKKKQGGISKATPASNMNRGLSINKDTLARSKQKIVSTTAGGIKVIKRSTNSSQSKNNKYNDFASAFGSSSGGNLSTEADIMNAKSRFSSATNAQEYARARAQVQELEAREATKEGYNNNKKKKKASDVAIKTIGWACRTCKKTTPFKPVACIKSRHDVRQKREIKGQETLSKRKDRLDRHGKDDKEGGLTLGSGVEWTRLEWSRGGL